MDGGVIIDGNHRSQKLLTPKIDAGLMIFDLAISGILGTVRNAGTTTLRMILTRAAGDSLEGAAAKLAYADGAKLVVHNGEVLGHDGTVLARQNSVTGKYESVGPLELPPLPVTSGGTANAATGGKLADDLIARMTKPKVEDVGLAQLMDELYRDGAKIGSESTADAVRFELATGGSVGGKHHVQKAENYSVSLQRWLNANPNASFSDRSAAEHVLRDMQNALMGK